MEDVDTTAHGHPFPDDEADEAAAEAQSAEDSADAREEPAAEAPDGSEAEDDEDTDGEEETDDTAPQPENADAGDERAPELPDAPDAPDAPHESDALAAVGEEEAAQEADVQHEESFVVRVLVDEGRIRRTTVQHTRSGAEKRWAAWEPAAVVAFVEAHVGSRPEAAPVSGALVADREESAAPPPAPAGRGEPAAPATPAEPHTERPFVDVGLTIRTEPGTIRAHAPFDVVITIDQAQMELPLPASTTYGAVVGIKGIGSGAGRAQLREDGTFSDSSEEMTIRLTGPGLPAGSYRLDAAISLREPGVSRPLGLVRAVQRTVIVVVDT